MANRKRNGLEVIAGQLESWVIPEFAGSTINNVRWSKLAPEWTNNLAIEILGAPLEDASRVEQRLFSQIIDDIDHVSQTVCGDPVSVDELVGQIMPGFSYPDKKWDLSTWMHTSTHATACMNTVLADERRVYNMDELLQAAVIHRADDMIHDIAGEVARLVEQWELDHAQED